MVKIRKEFNNAYDRIYDFVHETVKLEQKELEDKADNRWVGFDNLIAKLEDKIKPKDLNRVALKFLEDKNDYFVNAGVSILATPNMISYNIKNYNNIYKKFMSYIVSKDELENINLRSGKWFNFIRSVEGLLNLIDVLNKKDEESAEAILKKLLTKLSEKHKNYLKEICDAPDMDGTMIKKYFGK